MLYEIALSLIEGIGPIHAKSLIHYYGSAEAVFRDKKLHMKVPGLGPILSNLVRNADTLRRAEEELAFMERNGIRALFYKDDNYPRKLKHCDDGPIILYVKGNADFNAERVISIVGTRHPTEYGLQVCHELVKELSGYQPVVVSGLALGIDSMAHKAALENGLETWAAVGHGLDRIYPSENRELARQIRECGAIVSEFTSGTMPDRENFPMRNRIVAGMADATIVVESAIKGGSVITAELAAEYSRDVYAVPGRVNDPTSGGCNRLIASSKAALFISAGELAADLGWSPRSDKPGAIQGSLLLELSELEQQIIAYVREKTGASIDDISLALKMPVSRINAEVLSMELKGLLRLLPGKMVTAG